MICTKTYDISHLSHTGYVWHVLQAGSPLIQATDLVAVLDGQSILHILWHSRAAVSPTPPTRAAPLQYTEPTVYTMGRQPHEGNFMPYTTDQYLMFCGLSIYIEGLGSDE